MGKKFPFAVVFIPIFLGILGVAMVLSTSIGWEIGKAGITIAFLKQFLFFVLSLLLYFFVSRIRPNFWKALSVILLYLSILALLYTVLRGTTINSAKRWISVAGITIQPSLFAQVFLVMYIAKERSLLKGTIAALITSLLIMLEPDISAAGVTIMTATIILYLKGMKIKNFVLPIVAVFVIIAVYGKTKGYPLGRLKGFVDEKNTSKSSVIAVAKGRILGYGIAEGVDKFSTLPLPFSDYIFASISQEMGFIGSLTVLTLFLLYFLKGMKEMEKVTDRSGKMMGMGLLILTMTTAMIHILICIGLFPDAGEPLPFISKGGSGLISYYFAAGVVTALANENYIDRWRNRRTHSSHY
ncbi:FtsW/RodA/SpoVE family cell cycle protein [candidate division WOR-3 bacterium]|nr:FtsW/RodA/SpoVE family cell cycle protein [candidate division WOR-3 bacterium]